MDDQAKIEIYAATNQAERIATTVIDATPCAIARFRSRETEEIDDDDRHDERDDGRYGTGMDTRRRCTPTRGRCARQISEEVILAVHRRREGNDESR